MGIQLASNIVPKNSQSFYLMEDVYLKGGLQIQKTQAAMEALDPANLKEGQLVLCLDTNLLYQATQLVQITPTTPNVTPSVMWEQYGTGGGSGGFPDAPDDGNIYGRQNGSWVEIQGNATKRQVAIQSISSLQVGGQNNFTLAIGPSCLMLQLTVSRPVMVYAYSTAAMNDSNPYQFQGAVGHLTDDGSMLLSDGTVFRSRNFSILANMETPLSNLIYFQVQNIDDQEGPVTITVTYLVTESL